MVKNIQDIIPDREVVKLKNQEFAGLEYEQWRIGIPIFSDQVETLLENGYMLSIMSKGEVIVNRLLNPSPDALKQNKEFWNNLGEALNHEAGE